MALPISDLTFAALSKGGGYPGYAYVIRSDADVAMVNALGALASGTKIGVLSGQTYRTQLTRADDGLIIEAVGGGAKPLFDASEVIASNAWTKTGGLTNVYQTTITLDGGSKSLGNCWADDAFLTQVTSTAACDAMPGSAYIADWTATTTTLYVRTATGVAPGVDGKAYSYSKRWHGIKLTGAGCTVRGVRTRRNAHQDGSMVCTGENATWIDCRIEDGCRHASLAGAGAALIGVYHYRSRNDLEAGQSANLFVCNQPAILGKSYSTQNCTWDGGDQPNVSALSNHGGTASDRWTSITHTDDSFINCTQCGDAHAISQIIDGCTFTNCTQGPFIGTNNIGLTIKNCSGSLNQVWKNDASTGVTVTCQDNTWTPTTIGTGLYRADSAGPTSGNTYNFTRETVYSIGATSGTGDLIRVADGAVNISTINVGPNLFGLKLLHNMRVGFNGGAVTLAANDNHWPFGRDFIVNGTTYATFSAYQTGTGQDAAGDTNGTGGQGGASSVFFSDNFDRADENLEASANWTRQGGSTGAAGVRSNQLAMLGTGSPTAYTSPDTTKTAHWARGIVKSVPGTPGPFPIAVRVVDSSNFIGVRWSGSQGQVWKCVAGTLSQIGTWTATISVGDQIMLVAEGTGVTVYQNGALTSINGLAYAAAALDTATKCGTAARASVLNPAIDNYEVGRAA
ncbi:hypothetical protein [Caulobacter phage BL94]|nr:hypothetical protein [Caulobacter phage BL94]